MRDQLAMPVLRGIARSLVALAVAGSLGALVMARGPSWRPHMTDPPARDPSPVAAAGAPRDRAARERSRIQRHLERVEAALRARRPPGLGREQRVRRAQALDALAEYRRRGVFPHNHTDPDARIPVFVDPHGTPCAVGYLLLRTGESDLVEDVVRADNNAYVPDLATDARLGRWLERHGLSVAEAAMIQPAYGPGGPGGVTIVEESNSYEVATVLVGAASAFAAGYSVLTDPNPLRTEWLGLANAALAAGHGVMAIAGGLEGENEPWAVAVNGGMAFVSALAAIDRYRRRRPASELATARAAGRETTLRLVAPQPAWVGGGMGFQLRIVH